MKEQLLHNVGLKMFSLVLAFSLWLVVAGEQRVEHVLNAPIKLTDVPESLVLVNEPNAYVTVRIRGPKTLVTGLTADDISPELELSRLKEGEHMIALRIDQIPVPRGVEVIQVSPGRIRLVLEPVADREVRVTPRLEGRPAPGHYVQRAYPRPDRVRVVGPRSEVSRIALVFTPPISTEGKSGDFVAKAPLEPMGKLVKVAGENSVEVVVEIREKGKR